VGGGVVVWGAERWGGKKKKKKGGGGVYAHQIMLGVAACTCGVAPSRSILNLGGLFGKKSSKNESLFQKRPSSLGSLRIAATPNATTQPT